MNIKLLAIPLLVGLTAQIVKFFWQSRSGKIDWSALDLYGGMPSTHTAIMVSLVTVVGLYDGIDATTFAIALIMAILVIRDAIGLRQYVGAHSKALNKLVQELPKEDRRTYDHYRERVGHTPLEALVGGIFGFLLGIVFYFLLP